METSIDRLFIRNANAFGRFFSEQGVVLTTAGPVRVEQTPVQRIARCAYPLSARRA